MMKGNINSIINGIKSNFISSTKIDKEKMGKEKIAEIILAVIFCIQFAVIVYFNIKMLGNHMGYDSSWSYLKAALVWKEKTLHSDIWVDQTCVFWDSSMPLAALWYGITGDLFLAYGIANTVVLILSFICINSIFGLLGIKRKIAKLISLNMMICPYLTNGFDIGGDLGYLNDMLTGPAFYSLRAFIALFIIREYFYIKANKKMDILAVVSLLLCALAGSSSGIFMIVMILFPAAVFILELVFWDNSIQPIKRLESIYIFGGIVAVFGGKMFSEKVIGIEAIDTTRTWTPLTSFFENFEAPLLGFMKLLGVLPVDSTEVAVLSKVGIYRVFPMVIFGVVILSIWYAIKYVRTNTDENRRNILFLLNIVGVNYLVFGLFNVQYGMVLFEERYLICTFMVILILVAFYFDNISYDQIFSKTVLVTVTICLIMNNYVSDKEYATSTNDLWQMPAIKSIVDAQDAEVVYVWGDALLPVGRSMRVFDLSHIYKNIGSDGKYFHWGDYTYYDNNADYTGPTLLIAPNDMDTVPAKVLNEYELIFQTNDLSIYRADSNKIKITKVSK